jgi:hypothetical protein
MECRRRRVDGVEYIVSLYGRQPYMGMVIQWQQHQQQRGGGDGCDAQLQFLSRL